MVASIAAYAGGGSDCSQGVRPGAYGAFVCYTPGAFVFLLPALAAVTGGMFVASSRSRGEDVIYAVRGLAGTRLAVGRLLAGSAAAAVLVLAAGLALIALALLFLPHRPELEIAPGITPGPHRPEAGVPIPALWRSAPLAGDLVGVLVYALAAAALAAVGNAAGQLFAQPLVAFAAPVTLVLATQVAPLPGWGIWVSGYAYLDLEPARGTLTRLAGDWRLPALLGYWCGLLVLSFVVASLAARRQAAVA